MSGAPPEGGAPSDNNAAAGTRCGGDATGTERPSDRAGRPVPSLADKLNQAFAALHPADRGPYSNREVAQRFVDHGEPGEPSISVNYIAMLRSGERDNPTVRQLPGARPVLRGPGVLLPRGL